MSDVWSEVQKAAEETRQLKQALAHAAGRMAGLLRGMLREVPPYILKDLKRELRDYNIHTGAWK